MADIERDRGQIILVAAFALAVIFLTLALVVNSAIFTENLASRSDTTGSDDALTNRAVVEQNVGEAMGAANRNDNGSTGALESAVTAGISSFESDSGQQQATSGQLVDVEYLGSQDTFGARIDKNGGDFQNGGSPLAEDVSRATGGDGTRAFIIEPSSMPPSTNKFTVSVTEGGDAWETRIWDSGGAVEVRTDRPGLAGTESCSISEGSSNEPVIDLTDGTVNGRTCEALGTNETGYDYHFGAGVSSGYDIDFANTTGIKGDFTVVVNAGTGNVTSPSNSNVDTALYDVTVEYSYTTKDVRYVTQIRVAPGEPDA